MVKVAILHNIVTPYRLDLFEEIASQLGSERCTVYYYTEKYSDRLWDTKQDNVKYASKILPGITIHLPFLNIPISINPSITKEIRNNRYDVVIVNGFSDVSSLLAILQSKILGIKVIIWSELTGHFLSTRYKFYLPFIRFIFHFADALIVPSTMAQEFHLKMGIPSSRIFISPNTINNEKYTTISRKNREEKEMIKAELSLSEGKIILYMGRLIERKGLLYLLEAFNRLQKEHDDIALVIVGDGTQKAEFLKFCKTKQIHGVYFPGFVTEDEKMKYYSISDVFVLPSLWELHPLVLSEAMACGLPVITTDVVGNARDMIIDGETGCIIKRKSVEELAVALNHMLQISERNRAMCIETIRSQFSIENSARGFLDAINSLTDTDNGHERYSR
jgi:glycosyltransferase involved in cell wall biosynthesis